MGKYYSYAQRLDTAYKDALDQFAKSWKKLMDAQEKLDEAGRWHFGETQSERELNVAKARIALTEAKQTFESTGPTIWDSFNQQRAQIKKELEEAVKEDGTASPDAVDNNGLEILKSGILSADEYADFAEKYDSNPTMLRFVAKYAREAADTMKDDPKARATLNSVAMACQDGRSAPLRAWDDLSKICDHCSGQSRKGVTERPEHIINMGAHWEELSAEAIQNF